MLVRLASMYTNWNLMGVAASPWLPEPITDIVRASSLLILVVMATLWVKEDMIRIYGEIVDTFLLVQSIPKVVKIEIAFLFDMVLHVGPVLLLGLPTHGISFLWAAAILGAWYAWARNKIGEIYAPSIQGAKADRGVASALLLAMLSAIGFSCAHTSCSSRTL
jgi:hypothetical protein